ncbi:hypothetical protein CANCADRAFT_23132 [Tortispora caseinolytica NRRL Y-17796]|uniref:Mannosyl-oligosaccharide glucosidase n=1 Tax=Tortispora caseinolytica NRRL Y-17796 TaxID=767744 RepID=A0A1E4TIT3_9ASCO|nr:hypothetical protein CANCADRAFT_23132 [Tortispora caseinolytica NRRL Y-17796]
MVLHFGTEYDTAEEQRLRQDTNKERYWKRWGPYLSERQWATVREDYSGNGDAWSDFPHEQARSRTYRWGEDGIAGVSDNHQIMCIAFAFWNGEDEILKERMYGLTGHQGNHGEDVKELYYYLDNTPTHSYMKMLYKYPQKKYPYQELIDKTAERSRLEPEFELIDTGLFDEDRYFDIYIEMAKNPENEEELYFRVTAHNRGPDPAPLHIIPHVWFRNTWSWGYEDRTEVPSIKLIDQQFTGMVYETHCNKHGYRYFRFDTSPNTTDDIEEDVAPVPLFTNNETNREKLFKQESDTPYTKDAFHRHIVDKEKGAINPENTGTKAAAWYSFVNDGGIPPGESAVVRFVFTNEKPICTEPGMEEVADAQTDEMIDERFNEAEEFYYHISPIIPNDDLRNIQRQALSGMLWTKQFYHFVWEEWAHGDPANPAPPEERSGIRNAHWKHLYLDDILSMPDKWEYPFFAAWDTAFHTIPLAMVDPEFAKKQLDLFTREWYMHPNGQIPAYEWNFSDVNPPVHAWAAFRVYKIERKMYGKTDVDFLERVFQKLLLNFTWWVNRKDAEGKNVFEGGFLGLDNIGVFNRSEPLPTGGTLEQADSTGWMAFYCLQMLNISLELANHRKSYEDIASKFFEHFLFIADAMTFRTGTKNQIMESSLWNEEDGFYYDCISWGEKNRIQLPVRSLVGLIPLYAVSTLEPEQLARFSSFNKRVQWFVNNRRKISSRNIASMEDRGKSERMLLALVSKERLVRVLQRLFDEDEFLSEFGIRSLSKYHEKNPYVWDANGDKHVVDYVPGDSNSGMFGGNSNWRGPIWFPTTFLIIESLQRFYLYYGDNLTIEYPKGSGEQKTLASLANMIQSRLISIFAKNEKGQRAYNGGNEKCNSDPNFSENIQFNEFFHADEGRGLGASHQLGWTGLIGKIIYDFSISLPQNAPRSKQKAAEFFFDDILYPPAEERKSRPLNHFRRRSSSARSGISLLNRTESSNKLREDLEKEAEYREKIIEALDNFYLRSKDDAEESYDL